MNEATIMSADYKTDKNGRKYRHKVTQIKDATNNSYSLEE